MPQLDEIFKNYTYTNEKHKALVGILFVAAKIEAHLEGLLEPYHITLRQYRIMRQLRAINPGCISVYDMKDYLINKNADTSRLAKRLINTGWVEKTTCENDRRIINLKITEKGLEIMDAIDIHTNEFLMPVNGLNDELVAEFNGCLELILDTFDKQAREKPCKNGKRQKKSRAKSLWNSTVY